ncbi:MAG: MBL fold metallo-hydrolase [Boseongicola sp. SB0670_bin_30]|nr:MBL fold metallo-hydrolase [Boseongicola sp. SB0670_bin_30]
MSMVHSYAVGNGDMFSIRHGSDNCTIIDCGISKENKELLLDLIDEQRKGKGVLRFISTHPDQDHLMGLIALDDHIDILNFYVVNNSAKKEDETADFKRYKKLRDGKKAFYLFRGCERHWMNQFNEERGSSGINICWPITSNEHFKKALADAANGKSPNNISPVITYSLKDGVTMAWFGDLETDFMESIKDEISWPDVDILFAPHHGRDSGKIPKSILKEMDPKIVVIGEAPSKNLNYYRDYNTITQNSAGSVAFECERNWVHIYVGSSDYSADFLEDKGGTTYPNYIGSLAV